MLQHFAVFGNPIDHSLSPVIHQYFAKQTNIHLIYEKIKVDEPYFEIQVADFFNKNGKGLNITLPFKQKAFAMAQQHTARCKLAGAANTLWMGQGQLFADNTDGVGLIRDVSRYQTIQDRRVLILGAGGAARGIIHPLLEHHPAELVVANRTVAKIEEFQQTFPQVKCIGLDAINGPFDLLINATSASLAGELVALPPECFSQKTVCYDLSYKQHGTTAFVQYAKEQGCQAIDGLGMLVEQAAEAFFIWHGLMPKTDEILKLLRKM